MKSASQFTTKVSIKGQVLLPKTVRDRRGWNVGTELLVEDTEDGVVLRAARLFPQTQSKDVYASLPKPAKPKTLEAMAAGIATEAKRRHHRARAQ